MRITAEEVTRHPFTIKVVRKYTRRLIKFGCFTEDEREAVEQELMSKVIQNWPKFDEAVGHHKSFVCAVVNHASVNMSRRTNDKCRDCRPVSLSSTVHVPDEGVTELGHTIGEDELDRRIVRKPRLSPTEHIALSHGVLDQQDVRRIGRHLLCSRRHASKTRRRIDITATAIDRNLRIGANWPLARDRTLVVIPGCHDRRGRNALLHPARERADNVRFGCALRLGRLGESAPDRLRSRAAAAMAHVRQHEEAVISLHGRSQGQRVRSNLRGRHVVHCGVVVSSRQPLQLLELDESVVIGR